MEDRDKKIKATLKYSISLKKTTIVDGKAKEEKIDITELNLGRLLLKDLRSLPPGSIDSKGNFEPSSFIPLIASSANIPIESAEQIDFRDLEEVIEKMNPFLPKSL